MHVEIIKEIGTLYVSDSNLLTRIHPEFLSELLFIRRYEKTIFQFHQFINDDSLIPLNGYFIPHQYPIHKKFHSLEDLTIFLKQTSPELRSQILIGLPPSPSSFQKCLFLDRDGILIQDRPYQYDPNNFQIIEEIIPAIQEAQNHHFKIIIVTNQSGIARGYFTEKEFHQFMDKMLEEFKIKHNICFDHYLFSPYHPDHGDTYFKRHSLLRKPAPGMIYQAMNKYPINLSQSIMVGDKLSDQLEIASLSSIIIENPSKEEYKKLSQKIISFIQKASAKHDKKQLQERHSHQRS